MKLLIIAAFLAPTLAFAAGDSAPQPSKDPVVERFQDASAKQDWPAAQAVLRDAVSANPNSPDYHNLYAYSIRKGSNPDMNLVFKHYNEALRLDPKHRGAHEYIGEAYLMVNNVAKAKEHLGTLDKLCFFPCSEFTDLKRAISDYEGKRR